MAHSEKTVYPRIGEEVIRTTLENGLPVFVVPKKDYRRKYAMFATRYGGMDMRFQLNGQWLDTPAGIAHYLEHKMFDTEAGNALQELAKNGAEPNAFTSNAITCYYFDSTEKFYENLEILLSFVSVPYFTEESVEKEQGIIAQEINMIEDNPEWQVYKRLMQALYHTSPARTSVAGSVESIRQITAQTLYDCHKAFYTPSNMCLVVVGDVDADKVLETARRILPESSGPDIPRDHGPAEDLTAAQPETSCTMEVAMPTFLLGFKCAPQADGPEQMRATAIGELACDLMMGESSPLYARLYSQGLINGSFGASYDILPGAAYVYAGGDSKDPHAVAQAILAEVKRLTEEGLDEAYYRRIINANFGAAMRALNSFESIAVSMVEGCFRRYDAYRFPEVYDSITQQDVLDFIRNSFTERGMALSIAVVVPFLNMTKQFTGNINQLSQQINSIVMAGAGAQRVFSLIDEKAETDDGFVTLVDADIAPDGTITESDHHTGHWAWKNPNDNGKASYRELRGDVRLIDVDFGYEPNKEVLHDVSVYAEPGQKVAFVGATGAGKTTITNLINRFYDIADGQILYDGIDVSKIKKADLRRSLGIVLQDVNLFTGTVMDNIRYGKLNATDEECIAAAKLAGADDFITRLPQGYATELANNGANLSQGQRQLISIARAVLKNPPIMILDEATSSIDTRTEAIVQRGMDQLMEGRTVFVIAHRLSTVKNSDVIMVLDHGRIIERGSHEKLIAEKGTYYQLYTGAFELE